MKHLDVLCRLIEFDTSGIDGQGCREAFAYLEPLLTAAGCETVLLRIPPDEADGLPGRMALVGHRRNRARPRLLIYGHVDVVPVAGWDGFTPRRERGLIYGRGAADMKGALAALLGALWQVRCVELTYDATILITMDEETHQMSQLRYLTRYVDPGTCPHVLSLDAGFGYVSIANLGLLQVDVRVHGIATHSGLAHLGRNAVEGAVSLMSSLTELKHAVVQRRSQVRAHPDTGLEFMHARLNLNRIEGGIARNVVPDCCEFSVDRRLLPGEDVDAARDEIRSAMLRVTGVEWEITREFAIPSVQPCDDPQSLVLAGVIDSVVATSGLYGDMLSGELPAAASNYWGGSAFATGLIRPDCGIHGMNEFVSEKDLDQLVEVLARFLTGDRKEAA